MTNEAVHGIRILLPRRKHFAVNVLLLLVLLLLGCYITIREMKSKVTKLPKAEGRTWPPGLESIDPGEMGSAVFLSNKDEETGKEQMKTHFMNLVASDKIAFNRSLPDVRMQECREVIYETSKLPRASVIIIFTDEAWSPLMRTIHSVINRSPPELLAEVLLVDDFSQQEHLQSQLDEYVAKAGGIVRLIRLPQREGLIRAKLHGAERAVGDAIVFLDAHCEANDGWLEPLLQRIQEKPSAIVCPIIDHINAWDFGYSGGEQVTSIGSFWWSLHFRWEPVPDAVLKARKSKTDPIPSPTMAGGLLAADRRYFLDVGGYDPGMDVWGVENLEISFRVWMCGGSVEFVPCSHVGHVFRSGHPYKMIGPGGSKEVHGTNSKRLAEVWMDDYKRLYYRHRRDLIHKDVGDLSERRALRDRLKCHTFHWYLRNVSPQKFVPDEDIVGYGAFRNAETDFCLDTLQKDETTRTPLALYHCQAGGSSAQLFSLTKDGQFRREIVCASVDVGKEKDKATGVLVECSATAVSQQWKWDMDGLMRNVDTDLCMDVSGEVKNSQSISMRRCNASNAYQKWEFVKL